MDRFYVQWVPGLSKGAYCPSILQLYNVTDCNALKRMYTHSVRVQI